MFSSESVGGFLALTVTGVLLMRQTRAGKKYRDLSTDEEDEVM